MITLQNFTCKPVKTKPYSVYYVNEILKKFQAFQSSDSKNNDSKVPDKESQSKLTLPPEPQNCCMSGCSNCVWVAYAEEVAKLIDDGGETAKKKIMENVKDPNLRAFLLLELSHLFKKGKK